MDASIVSNVLTQCELAIDLFILEIRNMKLIAMLQQITANHRHSLLVVAAVLLYKALGMLFKRGG